MHVARLANKCQHAQYIHYSEYIYYLGVVKTLKTPVIIAFRGVLDAKKLRQYPHFLRQYPHFLRQHPHFLRQHPHLPGWSNFYDRGG